MNARVRRLLSAGLLGELCSMRGCRRLVYVSRKGAARVGLALRRPPQPGLGVARELALAGLLASLETLRQDLLVLTQREGRRVEAQTGQRLSVDPGVGPRWPDLVIASGGRLRAVELEFAAKPRKRQEEIFNAYAWSDTFDDIVWIVALPWVYDRLRVLAERADNTSVLRLDPNGVAGIARTLTGTWYRPAPAK